MFFSFYLSLLSFPLLYEGIRPNVYDGGERVPIRQDSLADSPKPILDFVLKTHICVESKSGRNFPCRRHVWCTAFIDGDVAPPTTNREANEIPPALNTNPLYWYAKTLSDRQPCKKRFQTLF